jgi:hypothetical protein
MKTSRHRLLTCSHTKIESSSSHHHVALICVLVLACLSPAGHTSAQTSVPTKTPDTPPETATTASRGQSTVRGRVVYEDNGRPLSDTTVSIFKMTQPHQGYGATTDARGEFKVENLPAGRYVVTAVGAEIMDVGYLLRSSGSTPERPIVELDGTSAASVEVRVRRGGAITGHVTRADGSPAFGALIMLMIKRDGRVLPFKQRDVRTDKQGFYRFAGLPTGDYIVSADESYEEVQADETPRDTSYGTLVGTLYPGTTKISDATTVHVQEGGETSGINITLIKRVTHRVYGTIRTLRGGLPRGEASISIREKDETRNLSALEQIKPVDAEGRWWFDGVPDGTYVLNVIPGGKRPAGSVDTLEHAQLRDELVYPFLYKRQEVTVAGADLKDLVIELSEGVTVSGTIETENGQPLPPDMSIGAQADFSISAAVRVRPDRTFKLEGIPAGNVYPYIYTTSFGESSMKVMFDEYYVKSIYVGGVELQGEPLKVEEGAEIKGVRLVISREVATVIGHVRSAKDGAPQRGINVVLLPTDPARQRVVKGLPFGFTDAKGAFCASGAPGEYFVVAFGESDLPVTDEKIKALAADAPRVRLQPNDRQTVDLTRPGSK